MKTLKKIILGIILIYALFSCDNPISLGTRLDLDGPVVNFTAPVPRKAVTASFSLEGTVTDNGGIKTMVIKVEKDRIELPRQWRYSGAGWEISEDSGATWNPLPDGAWQGSNDVTWSIPVSLIFNGQPPEDGEYMFSAQAWDSGSVTDDNSFKTLILIIDNDPPKVSVSRPLLYDRYLDYDSTADKFDISSDDGKEIELLRGMADWRSPENISKFQTNSFPLQWSIEDNFNIWSFDLRFYEMDVVIDENKNTGLPDNYVYRVHQNTPPVPDSPSPSDFVKPNGTVTIPSLSGTPSINENSELKKSITNKTTLRVVSVCYDSANNVTQEKTLGFFVYWPQADIPWITFSGDIKTPESYNGANTSTDIFEKNVVNAFMVYPGVTIKAVAFHAQGIDTVTYTIKKIDGAVTSPYSANTLTQEGLVNKGETLTNPQPTRGKFDFEFTPEPRSAYYIVEATALSTTNKTSETTKGIFQVKDITFPDFPVPVQPPALEPLFRHISGNSITISGTVSDATAIESLCLVWINPKSKNAAANAQLEYFRDANYEGWQTALGLSENGSYGLESHYDSASPNKVWKLKPVLRTTSPEGEPWPGGINPDTQRVEYTFSKTIPLTDLNIGIGVNDQPLKSQVFLLRAQNPNPRVTIITHTPQGDEKPPVIKIEKALINNSITLTPGQGVEIEKFVNNNTITISGTWEEDSMGYLNFDTYLKPNFKFMINDTSLTNFTYTQNGDKGTWEATATVRSGALTQANDIPLANLKDTLVVSASVTDFGKNYAEDGAAWLVKSDNLRLVRISSEKADQAYKKDETIEIFLEFNKPVLIKPGRSTTPVLNLKVGSGTATASYIPNSTQSTRQYFSYTVADGQNTTTGNPLDVTGLNGTLTGNYWESAAYPFTWVAGTEEIRITKETETTHNEGFTGSSNGVNYYLRRLPISTSSVTTDQAFSLAKGKNISIDTKAPSVKNDGINTSNKAAHYAEGAEILINVVFDEPVKLANESTPPQLILYITNGGNSTRTTTGTPKVNNDTVTFSYTVQATDTTGENVLTINSFTGGQITDIAGTNMNSSLTSVNKTLSGVYINTIKPGTPTFRALTTSSNTAIISNTVNGATITAESAAASKDIKNYYGNELYFAIIPNGSGNSVGYLEYSLDNGSNWKRIDSTTGAPFKQDINGKYSVITRQTDKAGNVCATNSQAVTLNWDPGTLVSRIDSTTPNGTYTRNASRPDTINITVYFRKSLSVSGTPSLNLNVIRGSTNGITINGGTTTKSNLLSFTYIVDTTDNTPSLSGRAQYLDATGFNITATDDDGVTVTSYIQMPTENDNKLGYRKDILVKTTALAFSGNPVYAITASNDESNDEARGTIKLTFDRPISKKGGNVTITQQNDGYRLPAVLTEEQANRYKSARNFGTYYSKGTNGADGGGNPDTSTKYVLNYTETTVVAPNTSGTAQQQMAYDFLQAEKITIPVTSQDITVDGSTITINLTGSNALQVLGATYNIVIDAGLVQDELSFQWPSTDAMTYTYTNNNINRPFVRVDKRTNMDRITAPGNGGANGPHLLADYSNLIRTRARLDCRTPGSKVRYTANGATHSATGVDSRGNDSGLTGGYNWLNNIANTSDLNGVARQTVTASGSGGTDYTDFNNTDLITVGDNTEQGYVWRIGVISSNSGGSVTSVLYDEIAFRTVLTYHISGITAGDQGQTIGNGDQLWIRGGDAVGSSSIPGFPLNWQDDYAKLNAEKRRAGIKLLRMINTTNDIDTGSDWRWITWEISVKTYFDCILGRGTAVETAQDKDDAWQYGPRQWTYQRAGWSAFKEQYPLYPGKHRWLRIEAGSFSTGNVNFSLQFNPRGAQAITLQQP